MKKQFDRLVTRFRTWWTESIEATRTLPYYLWQVVQNFNRYGATQAAALSYYALFSIFPLVLLLAIGVNRVVGPSIGEDQIEQALRMFLPGDTVTLFRDNVGTALNQNSEFTIIALLGLIWAALGFFSNLSQVLDMIFRVSSSRSLWRQRLLAALMILALIGVIGVSFVTFGVLRLLAVLFIDRQNFWVNIGVFFMPFGLNLVIFMLLFRFVPSIRVDWEAIWPAAILGAVGWEIAKGLFVWYLENFGNYALVYGGIATVIVLLTSIYLSATILIISAEVCARLNEWLTERHAPGRIIAQVSPPAVRSLPSSINDEP